MIGPLDHARARIVSASSYIVCASRRRSIALDANVVIARTQPTMMQYGTRPLPIHERRIPRHSKRKRPKPHMPLDVNARNQRVSKSTVSVSMPVLLADKSASVPIARTSLVVRL